MIKNLGSIVMSGFHLFENTIARVEVYERVPFSTNMIFISSILRKKIIS